MGCHLLRSLAKFCRSLASKLLAAATVDRSNWSALAKVGLRVRYEAFLDDLNFIEARLTSVCVIASLLFETEFLSIGN